MAGGATNRRKGHAYEVSITHDFKTMGELWDVEEWKSCQTARYASRMLDDAKVDIAFTTPFNIQAKMWKSAPSYHTILKEMPKDENINVIFHKRPNKGEVVVMDKADFYKILKLVFGS